jgi:hypothetical protein
MCVKAKRAFAVALIDFSSFMDGSKAIIFHMVNGAAHLP